MFGLGKSVTLALVGWLWADILLGLFVVFLAAASAPVPAAARSGPAIEPQPIVLTVTVDGARLLGTDEAQVRAEQERFAREVMRELAAKAEKRAVALAFAYGTHQDPALGQRIARLATDALTQGSAQPQFARAIMKPLHDIVPGDPGSSVSLELYVYR